MRTTTLLLLLLTCLLPVASGQPTDQQLVDWLRAEYRDRLWPQVADEAPAIMVHNLRQLIREKAGLSTSSSRVDFSAPPHLALVPGAFGQPSVVMTFPGDDGHHTLSTRATLASLGPLPDLKARLSLSISVTNTLRRGDSRLTVAVRPRLTGALGLADLLSPALEVLGQGFLSREFAKQLGFFRTMCFDSSAPFSTGQLGLHVHDNDDPELAATPDSINILFVADNYGEGQMGSFYATVSRLRRRLRESRPSRDNEPLRSFAPNIRCWMLPLISAGDSKAQRLTDQYSQRSEGEARATPRSSFANMARLARVGLIGQQVHADVIVILVRDFDARARAYGNIVIIGDRYQYKPTVLQHELGHTSLGERLADEYVGSGKNQTFLGFEPYQRNVSRDRRSEKWHEHFAGFWQEPWDSHEGPREGAYAASRGLYSWANDCRMRRGREDDVPFCAVCRVTMARALAAAGGPRATIEARHVSPMQVREMTRVRLVNGRATGRLRHHGETATRVKLRVVASNLPLPWRVTAQPIRRDGTRERVRTLLVSDASNRAAITLDVRRGDRVEMRIDSDSTFVARDQRPTQIVLFTVDNPDGPTGPPRPPAEVSQNIPVGAFIPALSHGDWRGLELRVSGGGLRNWNGLEVRYEYRLRRLDGGTRTYWLADVNRHRLNVLSPTNLSRGAYTWQVRVHHGGRASEWRSPALAGQTAHFYLGVPPRNLNQPDPQTPLHVRWTLGARSATAFTLEASALTWSVLGRRVKLEARLTPIRAAATLPGKQPARAAASKNPPNVVVSGQTGWLNRSGERTLCEGRIRLTNVPNGSYRLELRAVNDRGVRSEWAPGGAVLVYAEDQLDPNAKERIPTPEEFIPEGRGLPPR